MDNKTENATGYYEDSICLRCEKTSNVKYDQTSERICPNCGGLYTTVSYKNLKAWLGLTD